MLILKNQTHPIFSLENFMRTKSTYMEGHAVPSIDDVIESVEIVDGSDFAFTWGNVVKIGESYRIKLRGKEPVIVTITQIPHYVGPVNFSDPDDYDASDRPNDIEYKVNAWSFSFVDPSKTYNQMEKMVMLRLEYLLSEISYYTMCENHSEDSVVFMTGNSEVFESLAPDYITVMRQFLAYTPDSKEQLLDYLETCEQAFSYHSDLQEVIENIKTSLENEYTRPDYSYTFLNSELGKYVTKLTEQKMQETDKVTQTHRLQCIRIRDAVYENGSAKEYTEMQSLVEQATKELKQADKGRHTNFAKCKEIQTKFGHYLNK